MDVDVSVDRDCRNEDADSPAMRERVSEAEVFGRDPAPVTADWSIEIIR